MSVALYCPASPRVRSACSSCCYSPARSLGFPSSHTDSRSFHFFSCCFFLVSLWVFWEQQSCLGSAPPPSGLSGPFPLWFHPSQVCFIRYLHFQAGCSTFVAPCRHRTYSKTCELLLRAAPRPRTTWEWGLHLRFWMSPWRVGSSRGSTVIVCGPV